MAYLIKEIEELSIPLAQGEPEELKKFGLKDARIENHFHCAECAEKIIFGKECPNCGMTHSMDTQH